MTFGNLGESSELVAVKAAGISIMRFAFPLFLFIIGIVGCINIIKCHIFLPIVLLFTKYIIMNLINITRPFRSLRPRVLLLKK